MTRQPNRRVTRAELAREFQNNLRVGLLTGSIGGVLLGLLYAAATLVLNPAILGSIADVVILVLGLVLVYSAFCLALGLLGTFGKTALFARTGRHISDTKTAAFVIGAVFFSIAALYGYQWCLWHRIGGLSPETAPGAAQLPIILTVLGVAVLLARLLTYAFYLLIVRFKKPEQARPGDLKKAFLVLAYMAGAFGIFVFALWIGRPGTGAERGLTADQVRPLDAPLRVLAVDGLSGADVRLLQGSGRMGALASLFGGSEAEVPAPENPVAPVTWTRIATGQRVGAHGIVDYEAQVVRGLSHPFTVTPNQVGLFQLFQDVLPFFRLTKSVPMRSYLRGAKGIWNIATDAGRNTVVVNWWVSYPAEQVRGAVVSDHTYLRLVSEAQSADSGPGGASGAGVGTPAKAIGAADLRGIRPHSETYPGSLLAEIAPFFRADSSLAHPLAEAQTRLGAIGLPPEVLAADVFYARTAMYLLERQDPDLWLLHLPGPDVFRRLLRRELADPAGREAAFREAIDAYWSVLVPVLEPLASGESARTAWLSLPGWPLDPAGVRETGLLALTGPGIDARALEPPTMEPTAVGLPDSESLAMEATAMEPLALEPLVLEPLVLEPLVLEPLVLEPLTIEDLCPTFLWLLGLPYSTEMIGSPRTDVVRRREGLGEPQAIATFGPIVPPRDSPSIDPATDRARLELLRSLGYIN